MRFLAFEGLDGGGKSTLIQGVKAYLESQNKPFVITREPGGTPLGEELRQYLLRTSGEAPVPKAEALLYQAIRAQHVERLIRPSLQEKKWVLSDRYAASSLAFQGGGRDLKFEDIAWLNQFSTGGLKPDLYVLVDLPVEESLRRLGHRGQETDRFEREAKDFHERVRATFLRLAKEDPENWFVLSGLDSPTQLVENLLTELRRRKWLD